MSVSFVVLPVDHVVFPRISPSSPGSMSRPELGSSRPRSPAPLGPRLLSYAPPPFLSRSVSLTRATPTSLQFLKCDAEGRTEASVSFSPLQSPSLACNGSGACPNMMGCVFCVKRRHVDHPSTADGRHHTRRTEGTRRLLKHKEGQPTAHGLVSALAMGMGHGHAARCPAGWMIGGGLFWGFVPPHWRGL